MLEPGGSLLVSAPTENLLFEVGRKVFGLQKPPALPECAGPLRALPQKVEALIPDRREQALFAFELIEASRPLTN